MAPPLDDGAIADDFEKALKYLASCRFVTENPPAQTRALAKKVHACTYALIFWKFKIKGLPNHARPFVEEIASDALQILPHFLLGYGKTTKILTRGILENTLRFVYFSDHPIEFRIMNRDEKWYLSMDKLIEYMKNHPDFKAAEKGFDAIARIANLYSELSAGIHGRRVTDLETRSSLTKIHFDHAAALKEAEAVRRCTEASNFILAIQNRDKLSKLTAVERRVILRTFPKVARETWSGFV